MSSVDLEKMNLADLKALQKDLEKAIKTFETRKLAEARAVLEAKARELGVSLEAILTSEGRPLGECRFIN